MTSPVYDMTKLLHVLDIIVSDSSFVAQELNRFETLNKNASTRWGRIEEAHHAVRQLVPFSAWLFISWLDSRLIRPLPHHHDHHCLISNFGAWIYLY